MKYTFSVLAIAVCGLWGTSRAMANPASFCDAVVGNLVVNCGFETGDFTGWTLSGNSLNPGSNYYGVDGFDANSGNNGAYMSQDFIDGGTAPVDLSQTLATITGQNYIVSFFLEQDTTPVIGYTHTFTATFGGTNLKTLAPTVAAPGIVGMFTQYSFVIAATGPSTVLNFAFENDDQFWSFDDVSVAAVPEPSTGVLAGVLLGGLLLVRRRIAG